MLEQAQQRLRAYHADVRWVAIPSIHLTLKFLGEADPAILPTLAASLAVATQAGHAFTLRLRGLGCFPNSKNPRVIWCGVEGETAKLASLQAGVDSICESMGFQRESRPFHPHLTLGRVNGKRNLQPLLDYIRIGTKLESAFVAGCFHIYRSDLTPHGAIYSVLEIVALEERE